MVPPPCRILFTFILITLSVLGFIYSKYRPPFEVYKSLDIAEVQKSQKWLEQNRNDRKYVYFKQLQGAGFNNQAQEILLFHHLALVTSRVYVYQPFIWNHRKASLPLSAFLLGPTKATVSSAVFNEICPPEDIKHVTIQSPHAELWEHAQDVLDDDAKCIVVDNWIFNWNFLASDGLHAIWPSFQKYLSVHFEWPQHIQDMVDRAHNELWLRSNRLAGDGEPYIAIHFRRGDFENHCKYLTERQTGFTTWTTLPLLQSAVFPPALDTSNPQSIMDHCYSSLHRVVEAIDFQLKTRPHIKGLYVLHDGAWDHLPVYHQLYKLSRAMKNADRAAKAGLKAPLQFVTHSGQLPVYRGERDWKVAVDVELARNAEVFIGNGYSSLSSQIIALRLADGGRVEDIGLF